MRTGVTRYVYKFVDALTWKRPATNLGCSPRGSAAETTGIVFSKDRPMQLDALLRSYKLAVTGNSRLEIIFSASSERYLSAYAEVEAAHRSDRMTFYSEAAYGTFRGALETVMASVETSTMFFLVDDILFIREVDISVFASLASINVIPSMRLGRNITWSYMLGRLQGQPSLKRLDLNEECYPFGEQRDTDNLWAWRWRSGQCDWAYPLSVDGNIFMTDVIRDLVRACDFSSPNTLEAGLQVFSAEVQLTWGVCFNRSRLVNLAINKVQVDYENRHGSTHQDLLLEKWVNGYCLDLPLASDLKVTSVHTEPDLVFVRRIL